MGGNSSLFFYNLKVFFSNPVWLACVFSWLGAQFIKTAIRLVLGKITSISDLLETMVWKTGGMPSSHSALVTSLCVSIGFRNGVDSDIFILSLCFFFVVIRDALGVRRSSGIQAKKINKLGKELNDNSLIKEYQPIKEVNGHTPSEVLFGCLLGTFVAFAFALLN